jgi:hypothetical protein
MKMYSLTRAFAALAILLLAGASPVLAAARYRIITEGEAGFKRGNTFFSIKMSSADFESRFGAADKRTRIPDGYRLAYLSDGIAVVVDNGTIRSLTFVMTPAKTERFHDYQPCNASTSSGINRSSSIDDVIKAEGQPAEKSDDPALGATSLRYSRPGLEYSFKFKDGVLAQITLTKRA